MDEQNVIVTAATVNAETEHAEPAKTEPAKNDEVDKLKAEVDKLKASLSKANSEAAEYKRQRNEQMDKSKLAEVERAEQEQAMREELETLRKEKDIGDTVNRSLALNANAEISMQLAEAWNAHDKDSMFKGIKALLDATETRLNNEALNRQPGLSAGTPPTKGNTEDEITAQLRRYAGLPAHR